MITIDGKGLTRTANCYDKTGDFNIVCWSHLCYQLVFASVDVSVFLGLKFDTSPENLTRKDATVRGKLG